jgi:hypothetical protein
MQNGSNIPMRAELAAAVALVASGKTYSEAATYLGLTRNQVAGACYRAGLKVNDTGDTRRARIATARADHLRAMRRDPAFNQRRLDALRRRAGELG